MKNQIEILAPVGSYETLNAAIKAGANSVYFGIGSLNMRSKSTVNFTIKDLNKIQKICKKNKIKTYLTINTIIYDNDIPLMKKLCDKAKKANINAIIASDISVMEYAKSIGLNTHISTQANISNIEAIKFYSRYANAVILARELTLPQIKKIVNEIKKQNIKGPNKELIKIEVFIHGALCISISGKCYMSLSTQNSSANRGACLQNCRRAYRVIDDETGDELKIDNKYVMSPSDLCTIKFLDKILDSGVSILKIEGRARSVEYVYTTVKVYREAVDSYLDKTFTQEKINRWLKELESVFNRGFWHGGYYFGKKIGEWSGVYGSKSTKVKKHVGIVKNYFSNKKVGHFYMESGELKIGDEVIITGPTTGIVNLKVKEIYLDNKKVNSAKKGDNITIKVEEKIRINDKVYVLSVK